MSGGILAVLYISDRKFNNDLTLAAEMSFIYLVVRSAYSPLISRYNGRNSRLPVEQTGISKFCLNSMPDASDDSMRGLGAQKTDSLS